MSIYNWFGPEGMPGGIENLTPSRCTDCNTPVRRGRNDPCKCFPKGDRTKCARKACDAIDTQTHRDLPGKYCIRCARKINEHAGFELVSMD